MAGACHCDKIGTVESLRSECETLRAELLAQKEWTECYETQAKGVISSMQAKIDSLMLEYCPNEMTPEQLKEWGENQLPLTAEESREIDRTMLADDRINQLITQADGLAPKSGSIFRSLSRLIEAEVIEKCAKVCEGRIPVADGRAEDIESAANFLCAAEIRSMESAAPNRKEETK